MSISDQNMAMQRPVFCQFWSNYNRIDVSMMSLSKIGKMHWIPFSEPNSGKHKFCHFCL
jgi:hypothetical protein